MDPFLSKEEGFTLVEAVVSVLLLSVSIMVAFAILASTIRMNDSAGKEMAAAALAQEYIEKYRKIPLNSSGGSVTDLPRDINGTTYEARVVWPEFNPALKTVEISVYVDWTDRFGVGREYRLVTVRGK